MAVRTFVDASGMSWEVFEVHRSSSRPGAVSVGHESGWLAFVSGLTKRRLAPYPPDWAEVSEERLENLCASARSAPTPRYPGAPGARDDRPSGGGVSARVTGEMQVVPTTGENEILFQADSVEHTVRGFAHEARTTGLPAIEAMVQLKALLVAELGQGAIIDLRSVRRWFVEAYYFERDA